jgi:hypothetical protein
LFPQRIELHWDSAFENAHLGYRVLRALSPESGFAYIGPKLIEGSGPYSLRDDDVIPGRTYYYRLEALGRNGSRQQFGPLRATLLPVAPVAPLALSLAIGPNPTSEAPVEFHVLIPRTMPISLRLLDVRGRQVKTLVTAMAGPGEFHTSWDGTDDRNRPVSSGVFFCQLKAGSQTITKRLVRLKVSNRGSYGVLEAESYCRAAAARS